MRFHADVPGRRAAQVAADVVAAVLVVVCVLLGRALTAAVRAVADPARSFTAGAGGLAEQLRGAGSRVEGTPLVGDDLSAPLLAAADRAGDLASAGQAQVASVERWATGAGVTLALVGILLVALVWLVPRLRWARRAAAAARLRGRPGGDRLLALRALQTAPAGELLAVDPDPAGAWSAGDPAVVRALAAVHLRSLGLLSTRGDAGPADGTSSPR